MKEIILTQGFTTQVDDNIFEQVNKFKWCVFNCGGKYYAGRRYWKDKKLLTIRLHHYILPKKVGFVIDHKDGNTLNNQSENLRYATITQNLQNSRVYVKQNKSSKYKGVCYNKNNKNWRSSIKINGKTINIGSFKNETEAALAYDKKATELFGEFANINKLKNN